MRVQQGNRNNKTYVYLDITQFPITLNHATTGHKLQGKTIEEPWNLLVAEFAPRNIRNWLCVVLSRVTLIEQLFLAKSIPDDLDAPQDDQLFKMMNRLRSKINEPIDSPFISNLRNYLLHVMKSHTTQQN